MAGNQLDTTRSQSPSGALTDARFSLSKGNFRPTEQAMWNTAITRAYGVALHYLEHTPWATRISTPSAKAPFIAQAFGPDK